MEAQLARQQKLDGEELHSWIERFGNHKWNSEFSKEMSCSCAAMIEDFIK